MKIGIVGGGINGLCCAWTLAKAGHAVHLFERDRVVEGTSSASSKLLHGGLRYLESGEFRLVREALRERDAWLERAPELTRPLRLVIPIYQNSRRGRVTVFAGLMLYRLLAGNSLHRDFEWLDASDLIALDPNLDPTDLIGGYAFFDGQMDDFALGHWVAERVRECAGQIHENQEAVALNPAAQLQLRGARTCQFDVLVNAAGPWAERLAVQSGQRLPYRLDLVRGSHLIVDRPCPQAYLFEVRGERRVFFALPWKERTLVGTTEVRQALDDPIRCSDDEQRYLLEHYNHYVNEALSEDQVVGTFAGLRPLIHSDEDPSRATREYAIHREGRLLTVLGGKWTTAMALSYEVERQMKGLSS